MARVSPRREVVEVEKDLLFIWSRFKLRRGCTALAKGCCCGVGWTCFQGSWRSNGDQCRDEGSALSTGSRALRVNFKSATCTKIASNSRSSPFSPKRLPSRIQSGSKQFLEIAERISPLLVCLTMLEGGHSLRCLLHTFRIAKAPS